MGGAHGVNGGGHETNPPPPSPPPPVPCPTIIMSLTSARALSQWHDRREKLEGGNVQLGRVGFHYMLMRLICMMIN